MMKILGLSLLLVLASCAEEPVEPLVFGANTWPGYEPAYVARELGYLDESRIHLAEFTNTTEVLRAFRNGKLHVAGLTLDEALVLRHSVPDLQVFMVVDVSAGADVLMARSGIQKPEQLKGKRIGVEKSARGAYFLSLILRAAHLSANEVRIVSLPPDEHAEAFRTGIVDAVVSFGLERGELAQAGAVALLDSSEMPGKIVDTLVVRAADADRFRVQLHYFAEAWFRALRVIQRQPARAYPLLAKREQVEVGVIEQTMRGLQLLDQRDNILHFSGNPAPLLKTAGEIQLILKQAGLTSGSDDLTLLCNPRFVAESRFD